MSQTPSRYRLLSAAVLASPTDTDRVWDAAVDAELIAQCDQILASRAELERLYCGPGSPDDPDNHPTIGPRLAALGAVEDELLPLLAGMRAQTWACVEAMARVAYIYAERDSEGHPEEHGRAWPALAAIEWLVGDEFYEWAMEHPENRAETIPPPRWRSAPPLLPVASIVGPDVDAELIRLCGEHVANMRAFNLDPADASDDEPLWQAFKASEAALNALPPPTTIAGVVAKARMAKLIALEMALGEDDETWSGDAAWWARDVVHDLLRLGDEPGPDTDLIALVEEIVTNHTETDRLHEEWDAKAVKAGPRFDETYMDGVIRPRVDAIWDMRIRLAGMQATTLEGFRAKARIVRLYADCDDNLAKRDFHDAMAWSLANDLLGLPCVWKETEVEETAEA